MSIATFKRKSMVTASGRACKRSGKSPGGVWTSNGPHCCNTYEEVEGPQGFSQVGVHRAIGGQRDMCMSQSGTPFRGAFPRNYRIDDRALPIMNASDTRILVLAGQQRTVKHTVLNKRRFPYTHPIVAASIVTGNLVDDASYGLYVQNITSANSCSLPIHDKQAWMGICLNTCARQLGYTKCMHQPVDFATYQNHLTKGCVNTPPELETKYRFGTCPLG